MENQTIQAAMMQISGRSDVSEQDLLVFIKQSNPYAVCVCSDPCEFCEIMATRQNNENGEVIFGKVQFAKSLMRNCYVGIVEDPKIPAAVAIYHGRQCALHIYLPK